VHFVLGILFFKCPKSYGIGCNACSVVPATSNCTRYTPRTPPTSAYFRIPSTVGNVWRLTPVPAFFLVMDVDGRTGILKNGTVFPKRKQSPPSGPTGPPTIPRKARARLAAPESPKGTSTSLGNEVGAYNYPTFFCCAAASPPPPRVTWRWLVGAEGGTACRCWGILPQVIVPVAAAYNGRPLPVTAACNGRPLSVTAAC
jgi:hypothetical protein